MKTLAVILGITLLILTAAYFLIPAPGANESKLRIGNSFVRVDIVDTPELRAQGLSGRMGLDENEGMLFVFEKDGIYAFWMKDMRFSIDIIWIDANGVIVDMKENVSPASYPASFEPITTARYVLELRAGWASRHGVKTGDTIELPLFLQQG